MQRAQCDLKIRTTHDFNFDERLCVTAKQNYVK